MDLTITVWVTFLILAAGFVFVVVRLGKMSEELRKSREEMKSVTALMQAQNELNASQDRAINSLNGQVTEINKGIGKREVIDVNSKVPKELRRVQFENMIYIADGPSDVPAFSLIGQNGGSTFAVYPKGNMEAMKQVEQMRQDGRVDMFAEADYREGTTACMWIANKILELADRIRNREKEKVISSATPAPHHLI